MVKEIILANCILTGLPIIDKKVYWKYEEFMYWVNYEGKRYYMAICPILWKVLQEEGRYKNLDPYISASKRKEIREELNEYLPIFFGELGKENFQGLFNHNIYWDCNNQNNDEKNIVIKSFVSNRMQLRNCLKNRKEKTNLILRLIRQEQSYEGAPVKVIDQFKYWGKCYVKNVNEFSYYLKELEFQGLIRILDNSNVSLTLQGLDYTEVLVVETEEIYSSEGMYEIGLSFAGEERPYVEKVAEELKRQGIRVFYDSFEEIDLWGKDLYQYLNNIYKTKCEYCIIFISESYEKKLWTRHELKSAQARAFQENKEYILPVRFDKTELPGLNDTIAYLDGNKKMPEEIAELVIRKLRQ